MPYQFPQLGPDNRTLTWMMGIVMLAMAAPVWAESVSQGDAFFTRLSQPLTSIQDGKPLRDALHTIAGEAGLNFWLDRRVDPTSAVTAGSLGPTVIAAITQLAESRDCVAMPVCEVLLVGRAEWVDSTAATLWSLESAPRRGSPVTVRWDDLTTPADALRQATGSPPMVAEPPLPHDLWPAVTWQGITRPVAVALVLAQFDRRPAGTGPGPIRSVAADSAGRYRRRYRADDHLPTIRQTIQRSDPARSETLEGGWLDVTATPTAHRLATSSWLAEVAAAIPPPAEGDRRTFTLKPTRVPAGELLHSLAQAAGRRCQILPEAAEACQQIVLVEAEDKTLAELITLVATRIGVTARWQPDAIVVSGPGAPAD
jgi:hypothetical protein